jgi:hypothetical protein
LNEITASLLPPNLARKIGHQNPHLIFKLDT